jgi:hypothetical protein
LEGRCGESAASLWNVRLLSSNVKNLPTPPSIIAFANIEFGSTPENVSIVSQGNLWRYNEVIALMNGGDWISATCSDPNITTIGVRFIGDENDGWVRVLVDGQPVWTGSVYGKIAEGSFTQYLEVSGLDPGNHTIQIENLGIAGDGGGIHAAIHYFACAYQPASGP